ncbi:hypothetical protein PLICRDRAFT_174079 [Plicaturopsis crispa FD-325 SS-3]|nr:hypothetical protein PLICRDRAFT_174079 [Plicaturopsis crispa FD-325 SS-3]
MSRVVPHIPLLCILAALAQNSLAFGNALNERAAAAAATDFDWYSLPPSENITWTDCGSGHKCARLSLPLDYSRESDGPKTDIALQMLPANDTANHKGTILINPGGPGISGTQYVVTTGPEIAAMVGPEWDILGFDARGTGATTPVAQCFQSESEVDTWNTKASLVYNASDDSVPYMRSRNEAIAQMCAKTLGGNGKEDANGTAEEWGPGRFMDTGSTATDMLRITQKLGQDKLHYFGVSYGTVLGQFFASMFPDKVGKMVIDGVCDADHYQWNKNLVDYDAVVAGFYQYCYEAGPSVCPLYEASPDKIKARVENIINDVAPLAVPFATGGPVVLKKQDVWLQQFGSVYAPVTAFPVLATNLVALEQNNQTFLETADFVTGSAPVCSSSTDPSPWLRTNQAAPAIACGDWPLDDFDSVFTELVNESPIAGPVWVQNAMACSTWKIKAKKRFQGPFSGNTSTPIFVISNLLDPVCPLVTAKTVHSRFAGSGLLVQNSTGHVATVTPSDCTAKAVGAYFANGTLPSEGTVCQPNVLPFNVAPVGGSNVTKRSPDAPSWKRAGAHFNRGRWL